MDFSNLEEREYQPPRRFRLNLLAVGAGAFTDVAVTYMLLHATVIAVAVGLSSSGLYSDPIDMVGEMRQIFEEPFVTGCLIALGTLCTVLGGFVSAGLARRDYLQHAFATGLVVLVYGFVQDIMSPQNQPAWFQAMSHLIVIPAAMVGGWLRQPRRPSVAVDKRPDYWGDDVG